MLQKPKRHKNNKESHLQNRYPTDLRQSSNAIRVKFSRYKQNQIFTNVSFDTLIYEIKKLRGDAQKRIWKLSLRDMRFAQSVQVPHE